MSAGLLLAYGTLTYEQAAALKGKSIWVGGGWQDVTHEEGFTLHTGPRPGSQHILKISCPVATGFVNGGHGWYLWPLLLGDFLTRVAFLPPPYAAG